MKNLTDETTSPTKGTMPTMTKKMLAKRENAESFSDDSRAKSKIFNPTPIGTQSKGI